MNSLLAAVAIKRGPIVPSHECLQTIPLGLSDTSLEGNS
jgi:hypothetical protein